MNRALVVVASALCLHGCMSMNGYGSARTLDKGEVSHTVGVSGFLYDDSGDAVVQPLPVPSYELRIGLADQVDIGGTVTLAGQGRVDVKYNPIRSSVVDLAIAPGAWVAAFPTNDNNGNSDSVVFGLDVPIVASLHVGELSLVPWAGPGLVGTPSGNRAFIWRAGFGIRAPVGDSVVLQPAVMAAVDGQLSNLVDMTFGIAIGFGAPQL